MPDLSTVLYVLAGLVAVVAGTALIVGLAAVMVAGECSEAERDEVRNRAVTPHQALMEAKPFDEPDTSQMELLKLRELLEDALEALDPRGEAAHQRPARGEAAPT